MGLCTSKEKVGEGAPAVDTGTGRTQQRREYQRECDGVQKQAFEGLPQGKRNSGEARQETSASQSTSGATGDRKRSVVSGTSRHSSELTPTGSQFGEGNGVSGGGSRAMKVLLLGSGESGKSTVLQQLKILHQNGFTNEELMEYRPFIFDNIVETGKDLVNARAQFNVSLEEDSGLTQEDLNQLLSYTRPSEQADPFPAGLADKLSILWRLPSTQELVKGERRSSFYLMDNAGHFLSSLDRISQPDYRPTIADVLRTRKKTSGIFDTTIEMDSNLKLHIYDVGGQRSERKKWIHCFDNVTLVIFCVSLSEYDQSLMEDKSQNRLEESLILFDSVVNSRWFTRTSVVLFLNKIDSFAEKLQTVPLEKYFPDYTGGPDINKAAKYILWRFVQLNRANLNIYPHVTQATDTSNIKLVFVAIKETILENSLKDSGVL